MGNKDYQHFEGREALDHVKEKRASSASEVHGTEVPGAVSAACDAAREMAIALLILATIGAPLLIFAAAFFLWKMGRAAWLGYSRLERMHRVVEEEKWEIEHHRPQERDELVALYKQKGLEGQLLDEVVDVLMADSDRLLRVMLEEEMGLTIEAYPHPLKVALGAAIGAFIGALVIFFPLGAFVMLGGAGALSAYYEKNRLLPAIIWNLAIGALAYGFTLLVITQVSTYTGL